MHTGPGYDPAVERRRLPSRNWAYLLILGYVLQLCFEFSLIRFTLDPDGRVLVTSVDSPPAWMAFLYLGGSVFGLVAATGFVAAFIKEKARGEWRYRGSTVSGTDVLYVLAWLQVLTTLLMFGYALFLPFPLFPEGSVGSLLESASLQLFILIVVLLWFGGRGETVGLCAPNNTGRMMVWLAVLFFFIAVVLDAVVTNPVADWLGLSLESEREKEIAGEIIEAREKNWISAAASIAVIGIVVPVAEELLFRGVIQTYLVRRWGALLGILGSSFWFAVIHVDVALFAPLFVIGVGLGYMRHRFHTLWGAILLHSFNNLTSVLYYMI